MLSRLLHNFWLKIFSLGLATIIWVTVHIGITRDFSLTNPNVAHPFRMGVPLPVSIITQPGDARVFKISPKQATATIIGEEPIVRRMTGREIKVYVDLTDVKTKGQTNGELHVDVPKDVTIIGLDPAAVQIEQISP
jgi:YbbR domain-containing protein